MPLVMMQKWKIGIYFFTGISAISVSPVMWYQLDTGAAVNSTAILAEHRTMSQTHRGLTESMSELNRSMARLNTELNIARQKIAVLEKQLRVIEDRPDLLNRKDPARHEQLAP